MTKILTTADFKASIASGVTLVDFYADWCGPCQAIAPIIEELAKEYDSKANITKLDVDASPEVAGEYGVMGIPTLLIFKDGELVEKMVGVQDKDALVAALEKNLN